MIRSHALVSLALLLAASCTSALAREHQFLLHSHQIGSKEDRDGSDSAGFAKHSTTPDGKLTCRFVEQLRGEDLDNVKLRQLDDRTAEIAEVATGKAVSRKLGAGQSMKFSCFTFTKDGKYLILAERAAPGGGEVTNMGDVRVYKVETGEQVDDFSGEHDRFGNVRSISVSDDGRTISISHEHFELDGK